MELEKGSLKLALHAKSSLYEISGLGRGDEGHLSLAQIRIIGWVFAIAQNWSKFLTVNREMTRFQLIVEMRCATFTDI